jgi:putative transposase
VEVLERLKTQNGIVPERIQVDNGSEFISKDMDRWAYENNVILDLSRPGKPTDNPFIESFNGSFRDTLAPADNKKDLMYTTYFDSNFIL